MTIPFFYPHSLSMDLKISNMTGSTSGVGTISHFSSTSQQLSRSGITYLPSVCLDSSATCEQDQLLLTVNRVNLIVHTRAIFCCSPTMRWSFNTRRRVHSIPGRRRRIEWKRVSRLKVTWPNWSMRNEKDKIVWSIHLTQVLNE